MTKPIARKKDTGEAGNGGQFGSTSRGESDVSFEDDSIYGDAWSDDSLPWDHPESLSWEYPASEDDTTYYEGGQVKERVLLDGTVESYDEDGTFTHVTAHDGSTIQIDGNMNHPYVVHRELSEFAFETHSLGDAERHERFMSIAPAMTAQDPSGARRHADAIAEAIANDELYRAEELCESAAQQESLQRWMNDTPIHADANDASAPSTPDAARSARDTVDEGFRADLQEGSIPGDFEYVPVAYVDEGSPGVAVQVRGVPDALSRDITGSTPMRSAVSDELVERVHASAERRGVSLLSVSIESETQRSIRRLNSYRPGGTR